MKNMKIKSILAGAVVTVGAIALVGCSSGSQASVEPGVQVKADSDSPTGYTAVFTYENADADSVGLTGNFSFYPSDQPVGFTTFPLADGEVVEDVVLATDLTSELAESDITKTTYQIGTFQSASLPMSEIEDTDYWTIEVPLLPGAYFYKYDYLIGEDLTSVMDPTNLPPENDGSDCQNSIVYVGDKDNATKDLEYIYARDDDQTGTVEFVEYTAVDGTTQPLGIYLPYQYDSSKEYKTIYASHGTGGNETEWFTIGSAANIMDNLIGEGLTDEAIVVAMDNTYFNIPGAEWDREAISDNIVNYVLPYVEANYSVSANPDDRSICGLSQGGAEMVNIMEKYSAEFANFGIFSSGDFDYSYLDTADLAEPNLYIGAGSYDFCQLTSQELTKKLDELGMDYTWVLKDGAHDWGTWSALYSEFIKDFVGVAD